LLIRLVCVIQGYFAVFTTHPAGCRFRVLVRSSPIIEHCDGLLFAPSHWVYDGQDEHRDKARLSGAKNMFAEVRILFHFGGMLSCFASFSPRFKVRDFSWLRLQHSPNWAKWNGADE
jgi:hypothetical protein